MTANRLGEHLAEPWLVALGLGWEALGAGSVPVGAVVVDGAGTIVAQARGRRFDSIAPPGQLSGSRIAHAEVNALAQLPGDGSFGDHQLFATVEPCPLCMGAALMTGVGCVTYALEDPYAGAHTMHVANARAQRTQLTIGHAGAGLARSLSALMVALHYRHLRPLERLFEPLETIAPEITGIAASQAGAELLSLAQAGRPLSDAAELIFSRL